MTWLHELGKKSQKTNLRYWYHMIEQKNSFPMVYRMTLGVYETVDNFYLKK